MREAESPPPASDLSLLAEAATEAGRMAMSFFGKNPQVWMKEGDSPVSEADFAVDRYLRETLLAARPGYGWLSEETADSDERLSARRLFIVDPIDGTRSFLKGGTAWCVSVAVVEAGRPLAGVLACPARREMFAGQAGGGATLGGAPLCVREPGEVLDIAGPRVMLDRIPETWQPRIRRAGYEPSLAYRIACIARGDFDATLVKPHSHDWDLAAADLILSEAGGLVAGPDGQRLRYGGRVTEHGALLAASAPLAKPVSAWLSATGG